jgi:DNA-binding MarR family transcriptional regulator
MFPHRSLSDRLALSEQVIKRLLEEGLVELVRSPEDASPIPPGEWSDTLRRYFTWAPHPDDGVTIFFRITSLGRERSREMSTSGYSFWRQLDYKPPRSQGS